jgi:hypothetical protein
MVAALGPILIFHKQVSRFWEPVFWILAPARGRRLRIPSAASMPGAKGQDRPGSWPPAPGP